jgi:hypothetical protein
LRFAGPLTRLASQLPNVFRCKRPVAPPFPAAAISAAPVVAAPRAAGGTVASAKTAAGLLAVSPAFA